MNEAICRGILLLLLNTKYIFVYHVKELMEKIEVQEVVTMDKVFISWKPILRVILAMSILLYLLYLTNHSINYSSWH